MLLINDHAVSSLRAFRAGMVEHMLQRVRHRHVGLRKYNGSNRLQFTKAVAKWREGRESLIGRALVDSA